MYEWGKKRIDQIKQESNEKNNEVISDDLNSDAAKVKHQSRI